VDLEVLFLTLVMSPLDSGKLKALAAELDTKRVRYDEPLAPYTTFKIGGPADLFFETETADDLAMSILAARKHGVPYFVLGLGANVLIADKGFRGLVIRNAAKHFEFRESGEVCRLWTESGATIKDLIQAAVPRGWSGLEHYVGIPSTVGGAIWQNLHFLSPAPERERTMFIAEVFESCEILSAEGERRTVGLDYVKFGYDDSVFHHRADVVLSATFKLAKADPSVLPELARREASVARVAPQRRIDLQEDRRRRRGPTGRPARHEGIPRRRRADLAHAREHHDQPGPRNGGRCS
jgi:UDP-N-acetylmuramate dehydrogenase